MVVVACDGLGIKCVMWLEGEESKQEEEKLSSFESGACLEEGKRGQAVGRAGTHPLRLFLIGSLLK